MNWCLNTVRQLPPLTTTTTVDFIKINLQVDIRSLAQEVNAPRDVGVLQVNRLKTNQRLQSLR